MVIWKGKPLQKLYHWLTLSCLAAQNMYRQLCCCGNSVAAKWHVIWGWGNTSCSKWAYTSPDWISHTYSWESSAMLAHTFAYTIVQIARIWPVNKNTFSIGHLKFFDNFRLKAVFCVLNSHFIIAKWTTISKWTPYHYAKGLWISRVLNSTSLCDS